MIKNIALILLFYCTTGSAQVYQGKIDKYPVVFEIMQDDSYRYQARYYYVSSKQDIFLAKQAGKDLRFCTDDKEQVEKKECFVLVKGGKKLKGSWSNTKGKTLVVDLALVDSSTIKTGLNYESVRKLKKDCLFEYMKLQNLEFKKEKEEKWENTILEWYKEPISATSFFRIKSSDKIPDPARLNKKLKQIHIDQVCAYLNCIGSGPYGGDYNFTAKPSYLSEQLLSVYCISGGYCGGAHPDAGAYGITLDIKTLEELTLSGLYWFSDRKGYRENVKDDQDMNMHGFEETWHSIVKKHYPERASGPPSADMADECDYSDPTIWSKYTWYLTKDGLFIGTTFPHSIRACDLWDEWPIIPYKDIEKYRVQKQYRLD